MINVGSMAVLSVYKDGGLKSGLAGMKATIKDASNYVKSLQVDFKRMEAITKKLTKRVRLMGLALVGSLTAAVMYSPFLAGVLLKIKTYMRLLGMEITKVLRPALEWLGDTIRKAYQWFKGLNPHTQKVISWFIILGSVALTLVGSLLSLGVTLKTLGFGKLGTWLIKAGKWFGRVFLKIVKFAGPLGLGLLIGALGVLTLDKIGVMTWLSKLGEKFRGLTAEGGLFYDGIMLWVGGFALLGSAVLTFLTSKSWTSFKDDIDRYLYSVGRFLEKILGVKNALGGSYNPENLGQLHGPGYAIGTAIIPADGMYRLHAGEQVISNNNNDGGGAQSSNIMVSFEGAIINLASNLDIRNLAKEVSREIADTAAWGAY